MVKLTDVRSLISLELPSYPGSLVHIRKGLTVGQQMAVREKYPNAFDANSIDAQKAGMEMLVKCIEDRNFEEEDGTKTAINIEALYRFSDADLLKLMEIITPIQEKKS